MKLLIRLSVFLVLFATASSGQTNGDEVSLPEDVMKQVVSTIIRSTIKVQPESRLIYVAGDRIHVDWLPEIENVQYVILTKDHENGYGREVYFVKDLIIKKGFYEIKFGYGDDCSANGETWAFRVVGSRVKDLKQDGGWGSGCSRGSGQR